MSVKKNGAEEIINKGFHYLCLPSEIVDLIAEKAGIDALGLWALLCNRPKNFVIKKAQICHKYAISDRRFTKCLRALDAFGLAWIEMTPQKKDGTFGGNSWSVSSLPKSVSKAMDAAINELKKSTPTIPPKSATHGAPTIPPKTPSHGETIPMVNGGDITKDGLITNNGLRDKTNNGIDQPTVDCVGEPSILVFYHWVKIMGKTNKIKFTPRREKAVQERLKEGYSVDDLKQAIDGCAMSPYHMGQSEGGAVHDDLELICRNPEKVDSFMATEKRGQPTSQTAKQKRNEDVYKSMMGTLG